MSPQYAFNTQRCQLPQVPQIQFPQLQCQVPQAPPPAQCCPPDMIPILFSPPGCPQLQIGLQTVQVITHQQLQHQLPWLQVAAKQNQQENCGFTFNFDLQLPNFCPVMHIQTQKVQIIPQRHIPQLQVQLGNNPQVSCGFNFDFNLKLPDFCPQMKVKFNPHLQLVPQEQTPLQVQLLQDHTTCQWTLEYNLIESEISLPPAVVTGTVSGDQTGCTINCNLEGIGSATVIAVVASECCGNNMLWLDGQQIAAVQSGENWNMISGDKPVKPVKLQSAMSGGSANACFNYVSNSSTSLTVNDQSSAYPCAIQGCAGYVSCDPTAGWELVSMEQCSQYIKFTATSITTDPVTITVAEILGPGGPQACYPGGGPGGTTGGASVGQITKAHNPMGFASSSSVTGLAVLGTDSCYYIIIQVNC